MINSTVVQLTYHALLGRRRMLFLLILPGLLLALSVIIRLIVGPALDPSVTVGVLQNFALATIVPLVGLLAGTGAIGSEIDDGSVVYLLAKPISRTSIVLAKLAVAVASVLVCTVLPVFLSGLILSGTALDLPLAFACATALAGIAYCVMFLLLAVVTRHAVVIGLAYALAWESLIGQYLPGARALSIQQWSLAVADAMTTSSDVHAAVRLAIAIPLLICVIAGGTWLAARRLRTFTLAGAD